MVMRRWTVNKCMSKMLANSRIKKNQEVNMLKTCIESLLPIHLFSGAGQSKGKTKPLQNESFPHSVLVSLLF